MRSGLGCDPTPFGYDPTPFGCDPTPFGCDPTPFGCVIRLHLDAIRPYRMRSDSIWMRSDSIWTRFDTIWKTQMESDRIQMVSAIEFIEPKPFKNSLPCRLKNHCYHCPNSLRRDQTYSAGKK